MHTVRIGAVLHSILNYYTIIGNGFQVFYKIITKNFYMVTRAKKAPPVKGGADCAGSVI